MKDEDVIKGLKILAVPTVVVSMLAVILIIGIPIGFLNAWVTQKLYEWFLLPLHFPHINLWEIYGITLLISHLRPTPTSDKKNSFKDTMGTVIGQLLGAFLALLIGYFVKGHIRV